MVMKSTMMMKKKVMIIEEDAEDEDEDKDEDEDEDDDDDDDDDEGKVTKWMLARRRRRKMMMWRGRRLRRKTDPKTRKHTLREPGHLTRRILRGNLQEKCRTPIPGTSFRASLRSRTAHGHLRRAIWWKFEGKMPAQSRDTRTFEKSHFVWKFTRKMLIVSCEPAQSKRTWTFEKSNFETFAVIQIQI